jgi:hypothetical protein
MVGLNPGAFWVIVVVEPYWLDAHCIVGGRKITAATKPTAPGCIPDYEPFPFRRRKKRRKVGPFSKRLSFAMLDLRTQEGRYARDICDGIAADLGGAPNAAQQLLCQMFALKVLRVQLLVKTILSGETVNQHTENHALGWMNSARRDLQALGLLDTPSGNHALLGIHPADMSNEQLDAALALIGYTQDVEAPSLDYEEQGSPVSSRPMG